MEPDLDFTTAWRGGKADASLSSYVGCSSAEYAMRYGLDRGDLAPIEKRSKPRRVLKGRRSVRDPDPSADAEGRSRVQVVPAPYGAGLSETGLQQPEAFNRKQSMKKNNSPLSRSETALAQGRL